MEKLCRYTSWRRPNMNCRLPLQRNHIFRPLRLYQKQRSHHQNFPKRLKSTPLPLSLSSKHSPDCLKGMITGSCIQFLGQNTAQAYYTKIVHEFYEQMRRRGWSHDKLEPEFLAAAKRIEECEKFSPTTLATQNQTKEKDNRDALFPPLGLPFQKYIPI